MSYNQRSEGNICRRLVLLGLGSSLCLITACQMSTKPRTQPLKVSSQIEAAKDKLDGEVSLSGDEKTIEELRKNIPEPKRTDNDLLRETLALLGEVKDPPRRHSDRFNKMVREINNDRRKQDRKLRDNFSKTERKERDAFLKKIKEDRDNFNKKKVTREQRKEFYDEQDEARKDFFANQRDGRKEFDAEQRSQSSDFKAYLKDRTDDFRRELKVYTIKYNDMEKRKREELKAKEKAARENRSYKPLKTEE